MRYELQIATRYLRARRRDAFISITTIFTAIGVMIGVAALVVVLAVMGGFEQSLRQRILTLTPQVQILSFNGSISGYDALLARANSVPGVAGSDPFIVGQAMISSPRGISGVIARGIDPYNAAIVVPAPALYPARIARQPLRGWGSDGEYSRRGEIVEIAIGYIATGRRCDRDRIDARGKAQGDDRRSGNCGRPGNWRGRQRHHHQDRPFQGGRDLRIRRGVPRPRPGLHGSGQCATLFGREGKVDGLEIQLINLDDTDVVTAQLRSRFGSSFRVSNWMEFNEAAAAGFEMLKRVYALVLLMLIGVAAFNLVATLIMVVMEKRKDIAVLMSMGATPREVRLIFVLKGLIVGAFGTVAGLVLGAIGCFVLSHYHFIHIQKEIYGMSTIPIAVQPLSFVLVAVASMILCLVATFYPARQASRELPVEVFRG